jgi:hypothetical protein
VKILHNALATAHALLDEARQHDGLYYLELLPGMLFGYGRPRDYFSTYSSLFATSYFHACGTCAMAVGPEGEPSTTTSSSSSSSAGGSAAAAVAGGGGSIGTNAPSRRTLALSSQTVVDSELRVKGVLGLRIADASVFPSIPSAPIAAVCMAVGEAAAEFLSSSASS